MIQQAKSVQSLAALIFVAFAVSIWLPTNVQKDSSSEGISIYENKNAQPAVFPIKDVYIVYNAFINLKRSNWDDLIKLQMLNLVSNGLIGRMNELHVCLSIDADSLDISVVKSSVDKISRNHKNVLNVVSGTSLPGPRKLPGRLCRRSAS